MASEFPGFGRALIFFGIILISLGLLALAAPKFPWIGRLPGDIMIQRPGFTLYVPLTSCIVASLLLTLMAWLFGRFR